MTDFDDATNAAIAKTRASLLSYGYAPYYDHPWLGHGVRIRHVGELYPAAASGTATVAEVLKHRSRDGDIEVIIVRDEPRFSSRVAQFADYHCVRAQHVDTRFTSGGRIRRGIPPYRENEILAAFRRNAADPHPDDWHDLTPAGTADLWVEYLTTGNQDVSHDPAKIDHALNVISRYASICRPPADDRATDKD